MASDPRRPLLGIGRALRGMFQREPEISTQAPQYARVPGSTTQALPSPSDVQASAYHPGLSERLHKAIYPVSYGVGQVKWKVTPDGRYMPDETQGRPIRAAKAFLGLPNSPRQRTDATREDAWSLYLGMPQQGQTFSTSQYRPTRADDHDAHYFDIPNFVPRMLDLAQEEGKAPPDAIRELVRYVDMMGGSYLDTDGVSRVMGNYTWTRGEDQQGPYLAYYDKWDLESNPLEAGRPLAKVAGPVGKPFEVYGRVYYNPETYEPVVRR